MLDFILQIHKKLTTGNFQGFHFLRSGKYFCFGFPADGNLFLNLIFIREFFVIDLYFKLDSWLRQQFEIFWESFIVYYWIKVSM
jgi:hypothetical protein